MKRKDIELLSENEIEKVLVYITNPNVSGAYYVFITAGPNGWRNIYSDKAVLFNNNIGAGTEYNLKEAKKSLLDWYPNAVEVPDADCEERFNAVTGGIYKSIHFPIS